MWAKVVPNLCATSVYSPMVIRYFCFHRYILVWARRETDVRVSENCLCIEAFEGPWLGYFCVGTMSLHWWCFPQIWSIVEVIKASKGPAEQERSWPYLGVGGRYAPWLSSIFSAPAWILQTKFVLWMEGCNSPYLGGYFSFLYALMYYMLYIYEDLNLVLCCCTRDISSGHYGPVWPRNWYPSLAMLGIGHMSHVLVFRRRIRIHWGVTMLWVQTIVHIM